MVLGGFVNFPTLRLDFSKLDSLPPGQLFPDDISYNFSIGTVVRKPFLFLFCQVGLKLVLLSARRGRILC